MKQILAWIGIIAIAIGFAALVYFTATGASANVIMATLFCMLVVPVIIYAFLMVSKIFGQKTDAEEKE